MRKLLPTIIAVFFGLLFFFSYVPRLYAAITRIPVITFDRNNIVDKKAVSSTANVTIYVYMPKNFGTYRLEVSKSSNNEADRQKEGKIFIIEEGNNCRTSTNGGEKTDRFINQTATCSTTTILAGGIPVPAYLYQNAIRLDDLNVDETFYIRLIDNSNNNNKTNMKARATVSLRTPRISITPPSIQKGNFGEIRLENLLPSITYKLTVEPKDGGAEWHILNRGNGDVFKTPDAGCPREPDTILIRGDTFDIGTLTSEGRPGVTDEWCESKNEGQTFTLYVNMNTQSYVCTPTDDPLTTTCSLFLQQVGTNINYRQTFDVATADIKLTWTNDPNKGFSTAPLTQGLATFKITNCQPGTNFVKISTPERYPENSVNAIGDYTNNSSIIEFNNPGSDPSYYVLEPGTHKVKVVCQNEKGDEIVSQTVDVPVENEQGNVPGTGREDVRVFIEKHYRSDEAVKITFRNLNPGNCYYVIILDEANRLITNDPDPALRLCTPGQYEGIDASRMYAAFSTAGENTTYELLVPTAGTKLIYGTEFLPRGQYKLILFLEEKASKWDSIAFYGSRATGLLVGGLVGAWIPGANIITVPATALVGMKLLGIDRGNEDKQKTYVEFCVEVCTNDLSDFNKYLPAAGPCTSGTAIVTRTITENGEEKAQDVEADISAVDIDPKTKKVTLKSGTKIIKTDDRTEEILSADLEVDTVYIKECKSLQTGLGEIDTSASGFVGAILRVLLSISGGIALLLIIRAGYIMTISKGNPEAIQNAREMLTSAIVGLLFILFSMVILQVVGVDILKIPGLGGS